MTHEVQLPIPSAGRVRTAPSDSVASSAFCETHLRRESSWHVCGIPKILYSDSGSDFTSQPLEQVGADLKRSWFSHAEFLVKGRNAGKGLALAGRAPVQSGGEHCIVGAI